ncbi:MAG TPA: efflux RND transporter periplasmic adaptor subunit [Janthinobacterium sp.]|jgi:RND family efflux transporter MFP subunit|nr:efflux RND transporter periplasmic adaptor subunit [Janthinobacterium sp.]
MKSNPQQYETDAASRPKRSLALPFSLAAIALALLAAGILPRIQAASALTQQTEAQNALIVAVIAPKSAPAEQELLLPGAAMPFADAAIYARSSGYVQRWNTDIGAAVKQGQELALIRTPELDAQLRQAQADLATAQANFTLAKTTSERWQTMVKTQSVSAQDADTRLADMEAKRAMLSSADANVQRLTELASYESIRAPFGGVVTARNVDVGALVTAGGSPGLSANAGELFHVQQVDTLRVFADVPQNDAAFIAADTSVYLSTAQYPGQQFAAKVVRNAGTIDPASRTLRVEVDVDNRDHRLMPGAYVQMHFGLRSSHPALDLPVSAILFRPDGLNVVVVGADNKTVLRKISVGRDFGTHMEITSGLDARERVIDNPGDSISAGQTVRIAPQAS